MTDKNAAEEKTGNLKVMVASLNELLTVQEKIVGEQFERIRQDEEAIRESNERFITFIKEAAMRLKNPMEVIEENISLIISEIEKGHFESPEIILQLRMQLKNMEQIRQNIIELNRAIVDRSDDFSEVSKQFLTK